MECLQMQHTLESTNCKFKADKEAIGNWPDLEIHDMDIDES